MTNIPIFNEAGGISTLILSEIPGKKTGHVLVRAWEEESLEAHLAECRRFCRFCGAERVYAGAEGTLLLPNRQPDYEILLLSAPLEPVPAQWVPELSKLTEDKAGAFADIYNRCFQSSPAARSMTLRDAEELAASPTAQGWLLEKGGVPVASAQLEGEELRSIAVLPEFRGGTGSMVLKQLMGIASAQGGHNLKVKVMSTNATALRMYEKSGFCPEKTLSSWYLI